MPFRRSLRATSIALVAALAACDDPVTPLPRAISVVILNAPDSMGVGDSVRLLAIVLSSDPHWGAEPTFTSRAPGIVAVDSAGSIRGIAVGQAWVVARPAGRARDVAADSALVRITAASRSLLATVARDSLAPGDTVTVRTVVHDLFGAAPAAGSIRFASSDTAIARVDSLTGVVRVRSDGDVTITARAGMRTSSVTLRGRLHRLDLSGVRLTQLAMGWSFGCGLDATGTAHCWGANSSGQLGRGTVSPEVASIGPIQSTATFASIHAGRRTACGVTTAGALVCWGNSLIGMVPVEQRGIPRQVALPAGAGPITDVGVGIRANVCAVDTANAHWCFGDNSHDNIGRDFTSVRDPRPVPGLPESGRAFATGELHGCGVAVSGSLYCWGDDAGWGASLAPGYVAPTRVTGVPAMRAVAATFQGTCALDAEGGTWCGGLDDDGGGTVMPMARVVSAPAFTRLEASIDATCGLKADGELWCMDAPINPLTAGLMGTTLPVRFSTRHRFIDFGVGTHAICGLVVTGEVLCRQRTFTIQ